MKKIKNDRQLKIGIILSYLSIGLNIVSGLIFTPWMVKSVGQSQYGLYTLANSLITLFLLDFGLSAATTRYLSAYRVKGQEEEINNFLGAIYKLYLIIDFIIMILLVVVYFLLGEIYVKLTPEELNQFKIVYIISATFSVLNFPFITLNGILTAYEKFIPLKLADIIYRVLLIGAMAIALLLGYKLYAIVLINAVVGMIITIFKLMVIRSTTNAGVNFKYHDKLLYKEIFSFSAWTTLSTIAARLVFNITPTVLGIVSNSAQIAIFGVIATIEGYAFTITNAINGMFMPRIAAINEGEKDESKITELFIKVGKFQFILNGLLVVGFAPVGKDFIYLWMGQEYVGAYYGILLVLVPGIFYNALQIANTTMIVKKQVKALALVNLATGVISLTCSFVLSHFYGAIGAGIAICIAYFFRIVTLNIIFHKKMKIGVLQFLKEVYLRMSFPCCITIILGIGLNYLMQGNSWWIIILKCILVALIYIFNMFLFGLSKLDKQEIMKLKKRRKK